MSRKLRFTYDNIVDSQVSLRNYENQVGSDNSQNLKAINKLISRVIDEKLTEKQKFVIQLYFFQGQKITEIANTIGVNKSTVSRVLSAAQRRIKDYVEYNSLNLRH